MRNYRVVALTDHSGHSAENSIYAILSELCRHDRVEQLDLVSRGLVKNRDFFNGDMNAIVNAYRIDDSFAFDKTGLQYNNSSPVELDNYDVILMRLPRPISDQFLNSLNSRFENKLIVNNPKGILETSSKAFLMNFQSLCPPIKLCYSIDEILDFARQFDTVLKPLKEYGGKGILKISGDSINDGEKDSPLLEYLESIETYIKGEGFLAMKFLKNVSKGDKRLIVVDGEILASSLRLPADGSWLCNVAQGGYSVKSEPDEDEIYMVDMINPTMKRWGVMIYGVDTLVGDSSKRVLSEINTMSIGGFMQAQKQTGKPIILTMLNKIIKYADEKYA